MKELLKLANEAGFKSNVFSDAEITSDLNFYLWMCELQKWLRDEHQMHAHTDAAIGLNDFFACVDAITINGFDTLYMDDGGHDSYEEGLKVALKEGLEVIELTTKPQ